MLGVRVLIALAIIALTIHIISTGLDLMLRVRGPKKPVVKQKVPMDDGKNFQLSGVDAELKAALQAIKPSNTDEEPAMLTPSGKPGVLVQLENGFILKSKKR